MSSEQAPTPTPDVVVHSLKGCGFDKTDCIKFVREHYATTLGQAKDIVHLNPAWADRYAFGEAFHDGAEQPPQPAS